MSFTSLHRRKAFGLGQSLPSIADLSPTHWYNFDAANITTSGGDITGVTDLGSGGINLDGTGHAPLLVSSSADFNGHPVAQFDGLSEYLVGESNHSSDSVDITFFAALKIIDTSSSDYPISLSTDPNYIRANSSNGIGIGSTYLKAYTTDALLFCNSRLKESSNALTIGPVVMNLINGGHYDNISFFTTTSRPITLAAWNSGASNFCNCEIAEVVYWLDSDLTIEDIAGVQLELATKYDITLE